LAKKKAKTVLSCNVRGRSARSRLDEESARPNKEKVNIRSKVG